MPKNLVTIEGLHEGAIRALSCTFKSKDGVPLILSGGEDRHLNLSNGLTGEFIKKVPAFTGRPGHPGHRDKIYAIAVWAAKNGDCFVVSTGEDKLIRVFNLEDLKPVRTMQGHQEYVHTLQVIDVVSQVITASYDRTVRIWDLYTGEELNQFRQAKVLFAMDFCVKTLHMFATGSANNVHVWNVEHWKQDNRSQITLEMRSHKRTITALAYPRHDRIISGSDDGYMCHWNPEIPDAPLLQKINTQSPIYSMRYFDDGCAYLLVTANWSKPFNMRIWNLEPKEKPKADDDSSSEELDSDEEKPPKEMLYCYTIDQGVGHTAAIVNLAILDDGKPTHVKETARKTEADVDTKLVASVSHDGTIRTWDFRPAIESIHRARFMAGAQTQRMV